MLSPKHLQDKLLDDSLLESQTERNNNELVATVPRFTRKRLLVGGAIATVALVLVGVGIGLSVSNVHTTTNGSAISSISNTADDASSGGSNGSSVSLTPVTTTRPSVPDFEDISDSESSEQSNSEAMVEYGVDYEYDSAAVYEGEVTETLFFVEGVTFSQLRLYVPVCAQEVFNFCQSFESDADLWQCLMVSRRDIVEQCSSYLPVEEYGVGNEGEYQARSTEDLTVVQDQMNALLSSSVTNSQAALYFSTVLRYYEFLYTGSSKGTSVSWYFSVQRQESEYYFNS